MTTPLYDDAALRSAGRAILQALDLPPVVDPDAYSRAWAAADAVADLAHRAKGRPATAAEAREVLHLVTTHGPDAARTARAPLTSLVHTLREPSRALLPRAVLEAIPDRIAARQEVLPDHPGLALFWGELATAARSARKDGPLPALPELPQPVTAVAGGGSRAQAAFADLHRIGWRAAEQHYLLPLRRATTVSLAHQWADAGDGFATVTAGPRARDSILLHRVVAVAVLADLASIRAFLPDPPSWPAGVVRWLAVYGLARAARAGNTQDVLEVAEQLSGHPLTALEQNSLDRAVARVTPKMARPGAPAAGGAPRPSVPAAAGAEQAEPAAVLVRELANCDRASHARTVLRRWAGPLPWPELTSAFTRDEFTTAVAGLLSEHPEVPLPWIRAVPSRTRPPQPRLAILEPPVRWRWLEALCQHPAPADRFSVRTRLTLARDFVVEQPDQVRAMLPGPEYATAVRAAVKVQDAGQEPHRSWVLARVREGSLDPLTLCTHLPLRVALDLHSELTCGQPWTGPVTHDRLPELLRSWLTGQLAAIGNAPALTALTHRLLPTWTESLEELVYGEIEPRS